MAPHGISITVALAAALALCGCGSGGGSGSGAAGGGSTLAGTGAGPGGGASGATQAHAQVALAALGATPRPPDPVTFEPAAFSQWNDLLARTWPGIRFYVLDPKLDQELRARLASLASGPFAISNVRNVVIDTAAAPALSGAGAPPNLTMTVHAPGPAGAGAAPGGGWRLSFTADLTATLQVQVFGFPLAAQVALDLTVDVSQVRMVQSVGIDASNPAHPMLASPGVPQLSLDIRLASTSPLLAQVAGGLTQVLDPLIRAALIPGALIVQRQIGAAIAQVPQATWGTGAPLAGGAPGAPALGPLADSISDEIQRDHMPFDTLLAAVFDRPVYGQGSIVSHRTYGDSAIWTGHYLAAEALRHDMTGDPRALAGAERALRGLEACVEVASHLSDGLLGRCVVPLSSPKVAEVGNLDRFVGAVGGVPHLSEGDISRDQYLGAYLGCTQAWLRVPALRARALDLVSRMTGYFERMGWISLQVNAPAFSRAAPLSQTPTVALSWIAAANAVDPARWGPLHDRTKEMASLGWLLAWLSSREVHESYYKFNLFHDEASILTAVETDPARYREHAKALEVMRDVIGHHENAWFDAVYGAAVPAAAPAMSLRVRDELERWTLRPRREFSIDWTGDPSVAKTTYWSAALQQASGPMLVAQFPLPIEKRYSGAFLWQNNPFRLQDAGDPHAQPSGIDLLVPYWMARAYGMIR